MEHRSAQRRKLGERFRRPLESQVVVISGGGGAIGAAVAEVCAEAGAHIAVTDIDEDRIRRVVQHVEKQSGPGTACGVVMDVTDERSVAAGYADVVRTFGGVDVVVPNAGVAHVSSIEDMAVDDFRRTMEINAVGYLLFMREGIRILKRQGLGGHVVVMASKNVFGPGKDFGAYSASKAAGHQLGKVAALELAPFGIRVNMINADAIFGDEETPSGLWATVGPARAQSRGMDFEQLPEYYRKRNLLQARVRGRHVGNAVVFFASNATPTTGATLPVDGGVVEAFPR
jgi:NAD(P)-dependent dehydrogenase (short-subunit alcohol dehydrogenase family)